MKWFDVFKLRESDKNNTFEHLHRLSKWQWTGAESFPFPHTLEQATVPCPLNFFVHVHVWKGMGEMRFWLSLTKANELQSSKLSISLITPSLPMEEISDQFHPTTFRILGSLCCPLSHYHFCLRSSPGKELASVSDCAAPLHIATPPPTHTHPTPPSHPQHAKWGMIWFSEGRFTRT